MGLWHLLCLVLSKGMCSARLLTACTVPARCHTSAEGVNTTLCSRYTWFSQTTLTSESGLLQPGEMKLAPVYRLLAYHLRIWMNVCRLIATFSIVMTLSLLTKSLKSCKYFFFQFLNQIKFDLPNSFPKRLSKVFCFFCLVFLWGAGFTAMKKCGNPLMSQQSQSAISFATNFFMRM